MVSRSGRRHSPAYVPARAHPASTVFAASTIPVGNILRLQAEPDRMRRSKWTPNSATERYQRISNNSDVYVEHMDAMISGSAGMPKC